VNNGGSRACLGLGFGKDLGFRKDLEFRKGLFRA
jgi:hypothetical protein